MTEKKIWFAQSKRTEEQNTQKIREPDNHPNKADRRRSEKPVLTIFDNDLERDQKILPSQKECNREGIAREEEIKLEIQVCSRQFMIAAVSLSSPLRLAQRQAPLALSRNESCKHRFLFKCR